LRVERRRESEATIILHGVKRADAAAPVQWF
jgi:hypothetical protein